MTCSSLTNTGLDTVWEQILQHRVALEETGEWDAHRQDQRVDWMWAMVEDRLRAKLRDDPELKARTPTLEAAVAAGTLAPTLAADDIAQALGL